MPKFSILTFNSTFRTETSGLDFPNIDRAVGQGVRGALMIAADEVFDGTPSSVVEVSIEDEAGKLVRRFAVSASVAPLSIGPVTQRPAPFAFDVL